MEREYLIVSSLNLSNFYACWTLGVASSAGFLFLSTSFRVLLSCRTSHPSVFSLRQFLDQVRLEFLISLIQSEWESYFHDGPRVDGLKTFAGSCTKATFHWYGDQTSKTSRYGCLPMKQKFQSPVRQIKGDQSITLDDEEFYVLSYRDDIDR